MDWFSCYLLSWVVSVTLAVEFCIIALRSHGRPEIFNSSQGAQFTSQALTTVLKAAGVRISMNGKGRAMDNIMVGRLWHTLKYEEIYLKECLQATDLIAALKAIFWLINHDWPHQTLGWATTIQVNRSEIILAARNLWQQTPWG